MCRYIFVIIDSDRLYSDRTKGEGHRGADHLWRSGITGRDSDIYQYQCHDDDLPEYRTFPSFCKLWPDLNCVLLYGDRVRTECRVTT